jgi:uncharacterized protein YndB with AHSA1/START domain
VTEEVPRVVRIRRVLRATPDRVFAAWTDAGLIARWMSPVGNAIADVDPRPGGRLHVTMVGDDRRIEHVGEFREVEPDRRLVFTWISPFTGPEPSVVTIELEPVANGTELRLIHESLPAGEVESHGGGWGLMLDRLESELEAGRTALAEEASHGS